MLVGAPNESLKLVITYYTFKYSVGNKKTLLESPRSKKKKKRTFKGFNSPKLVRRNLFLRNVTF